MNSRPHPSGPLRLDRFILGVDRTPLHILPNVMRKCGLGDLYVKRDDLYGRLMGGNKLRKMEFIVPAALAVGADTLVTTGTFESNHVCASAMAARMAGMDAVNILMGDSAKNEPATLNVRLQERLGVRIERVLYDSDSEMERAALSDRVAAKVETVMAELKAVGRKPYFVVAAGGGVEGGYAYSRAFVELHQQMCAMGHETFDIYVPVGTGSTYAGLLAGITESAAPVDLYGISIARRSPRLIQETEKEVQQIFEFLRMEVPERAVMSLDDRFVGEGYGRIDDRTRSAMDMLLSQEGLLTDSTYTGKAFGAMLDLLRERGDPGRPVVFWHTGGVSGFVDSLLSDE